ncbi:hypothetical protein Poli38472_006357 [Pythium oligandrum]|uniref:Uncharacterized protein n=1 Tax=Pythium oligandrum TaxID=41045 RepID=A0A8K1C4H8_PYTOL|nr:hypothetical protein Poli38472_006357 [Pythium oligandrum]|eukprot:TMW56347.1 hypothetical protein Poli38472_006357 [Pythium oligandrum]
MKLLKPLELQPTEPLADGYRVFPVADKWAELLPDKIPLRFSFFRYLGFYVALTKNGKSSVVRSRAVSGLHVTIRNEEKVIFSDRVGTSFKNGVYYVQDIKLFEAGAHTVTVVVEGDIADQVAPLVLKTHVHEFMTLDECADLQKTPYAPLREFVLACATKKHEERLRDEAFVDTFLRKKTHSLRVIDAKWWLKTYVEHTLDRAERQKLLQTMPVGPRSHKRKQDHPSRAADKREHDNLFERRRRDWKRVRNGDVRMFTNEPLHAGATISIFSTREVYHQLSLYAQV